jgi:hypothetical protein
MRKTRRFKTHNDVEVKKWLKWKTIMKMKPSVLNFVGFVQPILVLKVSCYIAPEVRALHPNRNQGVIAVRVISGTNTI